MDGRTTRRRSLGIGGGSKDYPPDAAQKALADHFTQNEQATVFEAPPTQVLVEDITRQWLNAHVAHLAEPTRYAYSILTLERFYAQQRRAGKMPDPFTVASVRNQFVRDFITFRESEGASAPTISRDIAALRGPINWALAENILASAPRIPDVAGRSKSKDLIYDPEQVAAILNAAASRPDRHHVLLYIVTALSTLGRSEAILELNADIQISRNRIFFNAPGRVQTHKRRPIVPIAPSLGPWLDGRQGRLIQYKAAYSEKAQARGAPEHFVRNVDDIGKAFEACLVDAGSNKPKLDLRRHARGVDGALIWLPARKKLGEDDLRPRWKGQGTPNTLRHSIHTYLAARGVPKAQIDTAAGHSTDAGTGDKYNHLRPDYLKDFVAGVEEFWAEVDEFTDAHRQVP
jgi:integrase